MWREGGVGKDPFLHIKLQIQVLTIPDTSEPLFCLQNSSSTWIVLLTGRFLKSNFDFFYRTEGIRVKDWA